MHTDRNLLALYKACTELAVTTQGRDEKSLQMKASIHSPDAVQRRIRNGTENETNIHNKYFTNIVQNKCRFLKQWHGARVEALLNQVFENLPWRKIRPLSHGACTDRQMSLKWHSSPFCLFCSKSSSITRGGSQGQYLLYHRSRTCQKPLSKRDFMRCRICSS